MLKRTTKFIDFKTYGDVFYSMKSAGKNGSTVQSTLHLNSKNFDSWYYSSTTSLLKLYKWNCLN